MTYSVLLLGATGTIGASVAVELGKRKSQFGRVAFLTTTSNASAEKEANYANIESYGLERVVGGLESPDVYKGIDIVVSCLGDDLCEAQIGIAEVAFASGVKHFYPAEFGGDLSLESNQSEPYFTNKLKVRRYLEAKVKSDPGVGYTYVLVGLFTNFLFGFNMLDIDVKAGTARPLVDRDASITLTHQDDVGKFVVISLLPEHLKSLSGPRVVKYAANTIRFEQIFAGLDGMGYKLDVTYSSREETTKLAEKLTAEGKVEAAKWIWLRRAIGYGGALLSTNDNEEYKSEVKGRSWEVVALEYLK